MSLWWILHALDSIQTPRGTLRITQIPNLKYEISDLKSQTVSDLQFEISDLGPQTRLKTR